MADPPAMAPPGTTPPAARLARLDMLRGLAALAVVLFHYTVRFGEMVPAALPAPFRVPWGHYGVHLFFVISGFVILMSLDHSGGRGFIRSRFIRLYPVYWTAVLLTSAAMAIDPAMGAVPGPLRLLANLTMVEQYVRIEPIDGAYWSLTYELGFYAMLYAVVRLLPARAVGWLPLWLVCGAAIFPLVARWIPAPLHLLIGIHAYAHLFGAGIALYLLRRGDGARHSGWALIAPLAAAPLVQWSQTGPAGAGILAGAIVAVWWASTPKQATHPLLRPAVWLGTISYALYVTHQTLGYLVLTRLQAAGLAAGPSLALTVMLALALGWAITALVERPAAHWLRAHLPRGVPKLRRRARAAAG